MNTAAERASKRLPARKSVLRDANDLRVAAEMIAFGARLQVLEAEVSLSRARLTLLYKELRGVSPPKGQLPFSLDWFLTWRPNVHASLFLAAYGFLETHVELPRIERVLAAYRMYAEQTALIGENTDLSFTRAWVLVRFVEGGTLESRICACCGGGYVRHAYDLRGKFVCGLCAPPPRAAKRRISRASPQPQAGRHSEPRQRGTSPLKRHRRLPAGRIGA